MVFAAIVAGGIGSRMNVADMPKQFLNLGDRPIIIHTIQKFLLSKRIDRVYIGVHPDWTDYMSELLEKYFGDSNACVTVPGGADRSETLFNVIDRIESDYGESDSNVVLTHDAVRPFVSLRIIEENIDAVLKHGAANTVIQSIDTVMVSSDGEFITSVPERKHMYQSQTPQSFNIALLRKMYQSLSEEEKGTLTDACRICTVRNYPIYIVEGETVNLKITTPTDYKLAQVILDETNK
ncbi:MAG: 2-C-methyl-D-erythritol 4-phosphate cytidylyltransferase [Clostridia bacterium]|nr:2-C-methyl-D-erythritol 4-phosphate cytidylyltransferase [Clostridia bacterium]